MPHERRPYAEGAFKLGLSDTLRRCDGLPIDLPRLPVFLFDIGPERPDKIVGLRETAVVRRNCHPRQRDLQSDNDVLRTTVEYSTSKIACPSGLFVRRDG